MPGVLQIEAMAQAGGLLVLNSIEEPERWSTYFLRIDDVNQLVCQRLYRNCLIHHCREIIFCHLGQNTVNSFL